MRDPYLYDDIDVLRNLQNCKNREELKTAEGVITEVSIAQLYSLLYDVFNTETIKDIFETTNN